MKRAKSLIGALVILGALFALGGCAEKEEGKTVIGISKIVAHPALDALEQGLQDELADLGYTDVTYDLQNANGEISTAASIASKFKAEKVDVAVGIATPTAQALVNSLKDIPVIYSAVTDPVDAGLVDTYEAGGANVTGASDMTPVKEQIEFLSKIKPVKVLGHIYCSAESNAVALASLAEKACEDLGIELRIQTVSNSAEVKQAAQALAGQVDAFYVSTDNTVVSAISAVTDVAMKAGIPVMSADPSSAEDQKVLAAWGFDYYKMGRATGRLVAQVLEGTDTAEIPTLFMTEASDIDLLINKDVADELGLTIPEDLLAMAGRVTSGGQTAVQ